MKILFRFVSYALVLWLATEFGWIKGDYSDILLFALLLSAINTLIRPVFTFIALPFNLISMGLASVFVNMFMIQIGEWIFHADKISGFWITALISALIMLADLFIIRCIRREAKA